MLFDTHCHLNFHTFDNQVDKIIEKAKKAGVTQIIIPGTDIETSKKAIKIAEKFNNIYAAVGIHPHHIYQYQISKTPLSKKKIKNDLKEIEKLLSHSKVVAIGEIGLDRYIYQKTKYKNYQVDDEFINLQKLFFLEQLKLAIKYKKALIVHNRLATEDLLNILSNIKYLISNIKIVFHCCEADDELLDFAKKHKIFIGVDGDIFYSKEKQNFVKKLPLNILVLETDSPFLSPFKKFPNQPKNLVSIAKSIAKLKSLPLKKLIKQTTSNANYLFAVQRTTSEVVHGLLG